MDKSNEISDSRLERDSMGEMHVPIHAYYGAQTERARQNFRISGMTFSRPMVRALGQIKGIAASVNASLGLLNPRVAEAIQLAAGEVEQGGLDSHFVVDIFQTGSGTSTNMNANEVIANRAREILGDAYAVHANDHVNMGQSSNDVIPTAIHLALAGELARSLLPALDILKTSLENKAVEFSDIVKTGRTHLQDATPLTLGQEFGGFRRQVELGIERIRRAIHVLLELPLGGTAVGTGVNTHPYFSERVLAELRKRTGLEYCEAKNHFEAQAAKDALLEVSGELRTVACSLAKIANDIRWLGSGPRCGLGELHLPEVQPGSSIMPGKVNPVIAESLLMVVAQVVGNDAATSFAAHLGSNFQLNVMMPVMAHNLLQSVELLAKSAENFSRRCVDGLKPNIKRLRELAEANISVVTVLAPHIGYDKASQLAKEAYETGDSVRQVALRHGVLEEEKLQQLLDLMRMTRPGV